MSLAQRLHDAGLGHGAGGGSLWRARSAARSTR
jgi:hypothetical protein